MDNEIKKISDVWQQVLYARSNQRFTSMDILNGILSQIYELHGDRLYGDDLSIITGLAYLKDIPVTFIAQYKGSSPKDRIMRRYGMTLPEGYRKSLRVMKQAEKFGRAVICLIDTPGAYPGMNAEERGQAEAIAKNLYEMSALKVPIISIVVSEGGSGGALALGLGNKVYMLEKAISSVVSPEGCASILWKDSSMADKAAAFLKLSASDIYSMKIIDGVISEEGGLQAINLNLEEKIYKDLLFYKKYNPEQIVNERKKKFRLIGAL